MISGEKREGKPQIRGGLFIGGGLAVSAFEKETVGNELPRLVKQELIAAQQIVAGPR